MGERLGRDSVGWGGWGGITLGEMPNVGDGGMEAAHCHVCTYATILHDLLMNPRTYSTIKKKKLFYIA